MRQLLSKIKNKKKLALITSIASAVIVVALFFAFYIFKIQEVFAVGVIGGLAIGAIVSLILSFILQLVVYLLGNFLLVVFEVVLAVSQFNDFIGFFYVETGWVVIRDLVNMFFVVGLLLIAFATVLKVEKYSYNKILARLLIMAVLVNFSKTICGLIIDFFQIVMLTFANAYSNIFKTSIFTALGIPDMFTSENIGEAVSFQYIIVYIFACLYLLVSLIVIGVFAVVLIFRIVALWILIIFSPLAFFAWIFGSGKANEWWSQFIGYCVIGPCLTFFLWISLVTMASGDLSTLSGVTVSSGVTASVSDLGTVNSIIKFTLSSILLIAGLSFCGKFAEYGGGFAISASGWMKKTGSDFAGGAWKRTGGAAWKGVAGGLSQRYQAEGFKGFLPMKTISNFRAERQKAVAEGKGGRTGGIGAATGKMWEGYKGTEGQKYKIAVEKETERRIRQSEEDFKNRWILKNRGKAKYKTKDQDGKEIFNQKAFDSDASKALEYYKVSNPVDKASIESDVKKDLGDSWKGAKLKRFARGSWGKMREKLGIIGVNPNEIKEKQEDAGNEAVSAAQKGEAGWKEARTKLYQENGWNKEVAEKMADNDLNSTKEKLVKEKKIKKAEDFIRNSDLIRSDAKDATERIIKNRLWKDAGFKTVTAPFDLVAGFGLTKEEREFKAGRMETSISGFISNNYKDKRKLKEARSEQLIEKAGIDPKNMPAVANMMDDMVAGKINYNEELAEGLIRAYAKGGKLTETKFKEWKAPKGNYKGFAGNWSSMERILFDEEMEEHMEKKTGSRPSLSDYIYNPETNEPEDVSALKEVANLGQSELLSVLRSEGIKIKNLDGTDRDIVLEDIQLALGDIDMSKLMKKDDFGNFEIKEPIMKEMKEKAKADKDETKLNVLNGLEKMQFDYKTDTGNLNLPKDSDFRKEHQFYGVIRSAEIQQKRSAEVTDSVSTANLEQMKNFHSTEATGNPIEYGLEASHDQMKGAIRNNKVVSGLNDREREIANEKGILWFGSNEDRLKSFKKEPKLFKKVIERVLKDSGVESLEELKPEDLNKSSLIQSIDTRVDKMSRDDLESAQEYMYGTSSTYDANHNMKTSGTINDNLQEKIKGKETREGVKPTVEKAVKDAATSTGVSITSGVDSKQVDNEVSEILDTTAGFSSQKRLDQVTKRLKQIMPVTGDPDEQNDFYAKLAKSLIDMQSDVAKRSQKINEMKIGLQKDVREIVSEMERLVGTEDVQKVIDGGQKLSFQIDLLKDKTDSMVEDSALPADKFRSDDIKKYLEDMQDMLNERVQFRKIYDEESKKLPGINEKISKAEADIKKAEADGDSGAKRSAAEDLEKAKNEKNKVEIIKREQQENENKYTELQKKIDNILSAREKEVKRSKPSY